MWESQFSDIDEKFEENLWGHFDKFPLCSCTEGWLCDNCEFLLITENEENIQYFEDECYELELKLTK